MCNLYNLLIGLCDERGITGYRMCKDTGISPGAMTDLKMGRRETLSAENMNKIASYFGVTVGYLLGEEEKGEEVLQAIKDEERALLHSYRTMTEEQKKMMQTFIRGIKNAD